MAPLAGVRLTLVSRDVQTPYSGMLPGLIAGHYQVDDVHIDLRRLCSWAGVRFIVGDMIGIDPIAQQVSLAGDRPPIAWDLLSLDTGSTPDLTVTGAEEHVTPVKPVAQFYARWQAILQRVSHEQGRVPEQARVSIGVVGSGAGGFELVAAMRHALSANHADCHWFLRGARPLSNRPARLGNRVLAAARRAGIQVHTGFDVVRVTSTGVEARDGRVVTLDETLWCTAASGPKWPAAAGLATDERGFVATDAYLRSVSHPRIFATGDVGTQRDTPSAKAGVFAVRQAPVLSANLRASLLGQPLRTYRPQRNFLSLLATGGRSAIGSRGPLVLEGGYVWVWKDRIDDAFMRRFRDLPVMALRGAPPAIPNALLDDSALDDGLGVAMRCRGCGAKVGSGVLDDVLGILDVQAHGKMSGGTSGGIAGQSTGESTGESTGATTGATTGETTGAISGAISVGLADAGDAAVFDPAQHHIVQSVDQLDAIIDDPWIFGRIATLHALSDVYTVNASAHSAQVIVTLAQAHERITRRELALLMRSVVTTLNEEGVSLIGGHTAEGSSLALGLVVNALQAPPEDLPSRGNESDSHTSLRPGARLVLSQAIGVGTIFAALARGRASGAQVQNALEVMQQSNREAATILRAHGAGAMTDVTGFGLLGHLLRMNFPAQRIALIDASLVPLLPGALALAKVGVHSSLWPSAAPLLDAVDGSQCLSPAQRYLLCDPQTGGGLLAVVPEESADSCVANLVGAGYRDAAVIGHITEGKRHRLVPGAVSERQKTHI